MQILCLSTWEFRENTKYPKTMIKINQYSNQLTKGAKVLKKEVEKEKKHSNLPKAAEVGLNL